MHISATDRSSIGSSGCSLPYPWAGSKNTKMRLKKFLCCKSILGCFHRLWIDCMTTFFKENKACRTMVKNVRNVHIVLNNNNLISCQFGIEGYNFSNESFFGLSSSSYAALFSNHKPSKRKSLFISTRKNNMAVNISSTLRTVRRRDY